MKQKQHKYIGYRYRNHKNHMIYRVLRLEKNLKAYDTVAKLARWYNIKFKDVMLKPIKAKSEQHALVRIKGYFIK